MTQHIYAIALIDFPFSLGFYMFSLNQQKMSLIRRIFGLSSTETVPSPSPLIIKKCPKNPKFEFSYKHLTGNHLEPCLSIPLKHPFLTSKLYLNQPEIDDHNHSPSTVLLIKPIEGDGNDKSRKNLFLYLRLQLVKPKVHESELFNQWCIRHQRQELFSLQQGTFDPNGTSISWAPITLLQSENVSPYKKAFLWQPDDNTAESFFRLQFNFLSSHFITRLSSADHYDQQKILFIVEIFSITEKIKLESHSVILHLSRGNAVSRYTRDLAADVPRPPPAVDDHDQLEDNLAALQSAITLVNTAKLYPHYSIFEKVKIGKGYFEYSLSNLRSTEEAGVYLLEDSTTKSAILSISSVNFEVIPEFTQELVRTTVTLELTRNAEYLTPTEQCILQNGSQLKLSILEHCSDDELLLDTYQVKANQWNIIWKPNSQSAEEHLQIQVQFTFLERLEKRFYLLITSYLLWNGVKLDEAKCQIIPNSAVSGSKLAKNGFNCLPITRSYQITKVFYYNFTNKSDPLRHRHHHLSTSYQIYLIQGTNLTRPQLKACLSAQLKTKQKKFIISNVCNLNNLNADEDDNSDGVDLKSTYLSFNGQYGNEVENMYNTVVHNGVYCVHYCVVEDEFYKKLKLDVKYINDSEFVNQYR